MTENPNEPVVISLHGIKTRGTWQRKLNPLLAKKFTHYPLDYGNFLAIQLLMPWQREEKVDWFAEEYNRIRKDHPNAQISVVAHSFGTYIVAMALRKYSTIKLDQIIFCGSIVFPRYQWTTRYEHGQFSRVLNECGGRDRWVRIVERFVSDAGPSGIDGFNDIAEGRVTQRFCPQLRHSDFFELGRFGEWVQFLKGDALPAPKSAPEIIINPEYLLPRIAFITLVVAATTAYFAITKRPAREISPPSVSPSNAIATNKVFSSPESSVPGLTEAEQQVSSLRQSVLIVRGNWEASRHSGKGVEGVLAQAPKLASQLLVLQTNINLGHQIDRDQYAAFAYVMAAETALTKGYTNECRDYISRGLALAESALQFVDQAYARAKSGDKLQYYNRLVKNVEDDNDRGRILYLKAMLLSMDQLVNGNIRRSEVRELINQIGESALDQLKVTPTNEVRLKDIL